MHRMEQDIQDVSCYGGVDGFIGGDDDGIGLF
jgi:hypothetical protein